jgi:hypothetical protein
MSVAQQIVDALLENLDSLEGVPDFDEFLTTAIRDPKSPEARINNLRWSPPKTADEARRMGVNWFIKNGRKYTFSMPEVSSRVPFQNSKTMATNRNIRRKSFGYRDTYSMRERGWPTSERRPDGSLIKHRPVPEPPPKYEI